MSSFLPHFPKSITSLHIYGSTLHHTKKGDSLMDLLMTTSHTRQWHKQNNVINPAHYKISYYEWIQKSGGKVWYHTNLEVDGKKIKYGIMEKQDLIDDCINWTSLYAAGRLQKPVITVQSDPEIASAIQQNLTNAMLTATLLLPRSFTRKELYHKIAGLSYLGDFRVSVGGEDKRKLDKIVESQMSAFEELYKQPLGQHQWLTRRDDHFEQSRSMVEDVPKPLKRFLSAKDSFPLTDRQIAMIEKELQRIVFWPSIIQALKGILTAGLWTSILYAVRKLRKRWQS